MGQPAGTPPQAHKKSQTAALQHLASEEGDEKVIIISIGPSLYSITYIWAVWFEYFLEIS